MKRLTAVAFSILLLSGCASRSHTVSMISQLASNPLVSSLMSRLGLNSKQAVGGAGALLGLAQNKLAAEDWSKIAAAVPDTDDLVKTANSLGGTTSKAGSLADLSDVFSKIGLSFEQVTRMVPVLSDYVGKSAGADLGNRLSSVLK
jgi:hypothetical protein